MVAITLYVEGGGDSGPQRTACRKGFSEFLEKAGLKGHMPKIVACGSRRGAYESFCTALRSGQRAAMLLVDSEAPQSAGSNWGHLLERDGDGWNRPVDARDNDCHMMVQCMESWFVADPDSLEAFYGQGFNRNALPAPQRAIEEVPKSDIYRSLARATSNCKTKSRYDKSAHSFAILSCIDPEKVAARLPSASEFVDELKMRNGLKPRTRSAPP